jgi:hypothetical protein
MNRQADPFENPKEPFFAKAPPNNRTKKVTYTTKNIKIKCDKIGRR